MFLKYHDFFNVFFYTKINKVFFHHLSDHKISLIFNKKLSFNFIYDMFQDELKILKKHFDDNFIKGFIRSSFFLITLFNYFTRKLNEEFRFYINYRIFNIIIIIKNRYSLFLIQKTLSRIY